MTQAVADEWYRITDYVPQSESARRAAGRFVSLFPFVGLSRSVASLPVRDVSDMEYSGQPIIPAEVLEADEDLLLRMHDTLSYLERRRGVFDDAADIFEARNLRIGEELCSDQNVVEHTSGKPAGDLP